MPFGLQDEVISPPVGFGHPDDEVLASAPSGVLNKNTTIGEGPTSTEKPNISQITPWDMVKSGTAAIGHGWESAMAGLMNVLDPSSRGVIPRVVGNLLGYNTVTQPTFRIDPRLKELKTEETPVPYRFQAGQPTMTGPFANADIDPVNRFLNKLVEGGSTPGNLPVLLAGGLAGATKTAIPALAQKIAGVYYTTQMAPASVESYQKLISPTSPNAPVGDKVETALDFVLNSLGTVGAGHQLVAEKPVVSSGLTGDDIPFTSNPRDSIVLGNAAWQDVQKRPYQPTYDLPQPTIEQPILSPYQTQPGDIVPAYASSGEPKQGGQISFASPAEAKAIPSARQSAIDTTREVIDPTIIAKKLGLIYKEWPQEIPGIGGLGSYTDPSTGFTIEGVKPGSTLEQIKQRMQRKNGEQYASTIRSNEGQSTQEAGQEGQTEIQQTGGGELRSGNIQRPSTEGVNPHGTELRSEGTGERGKGLKFYSNPLADPEFWKNASQDVKDFVAKVKDDMGGFVLSGPRIALSESGFKSPDKEVDAQQLYNRLRNKTPQAEWEYYKNVLPQEGKISPLEAAKKMQESGPKVEVRKFGQTADSAIDTEYAQLEHEFDSLPTAQYRAIKDYAMGNVSENVLTPFADEKMLQKIKRFKEVRQLVIDQPPRTEGSHWSSIAPKAEKDMPGYVEIAVSKSQREAGEGPLSIVEERQRQQFPSSHSFPPNTLAFARGYMETLPNGKKVFHVVEVQSDWAQRQRELKAQPQDSMEAMQRIHANDLKNLNDPLLAHYERLALKAVIEHAKKEGADAVAVSDAETAMMTEGHDRGAPEPWVIDGDKNVNLAKEIIKNTPQNQISEEVFRIAKGEKLTWLSYTPENLRRLGFYIRKGEATPPQEPGMRLHYDRTLPKIMEELTGQKGERMELGEHRMAFDPNTIWDALPGETREQALQRQSGLARKDLIFRNPDNTPKTSISARMYELPKSDIRPTLFESDKPATIAQRLYTNPILDPDFWKRTGQDLSTAKETLKASAKKFKNWVDKAIDEPRPLGWSPYWMASKEERAKALLGDTPHRTLEDKEIGQGRQPGEAKPPLSGAKEFATQVRNVINKADKSIMVKDAIIDWLDNSKGRFDGTIAQHIVWPMDDNFQQELALRDKYLKPLATVMKENQLDQFNGERIGVALISKQEGGVERLKASGVTDATIKNINASLTTGEQRAINAINKAHDEMFPGIQSVAKKFGIEVNKVDNYLSWQRDYKKFDAPPKEMALPKANENATMDDVTKWIADSYPAKTTKPASGFTIERQKGAKTSIKVNAFEVFDRHIRDAAHFVAMAEHLKDVGEIVRNEKFAEKYGKLGQSIVLDWLNTVARQGRSVNSIPLLDSLRKRSSVGILAYRLASQVIHTVNIPFGLMRAGPEYWRRGIVASMTKEGQAWLKQNAGETFERGGGEPGITELDTSELSTKTAPKKFIAGAVKHGFSIQRFIDQKVAQATTIGVYQKLLAEKGKEAGQWMALPVDKEALAQARVLSRRAVASPLYKDTPRILNQGSVAKLFFQFQNTFLDQWSNIRHDLPEYLQNDPKSAAKLAVAVMAMLALESVVKLGIKHGLQQAVGYQPKQDDSLAHKGMEELVKRVPGGGQLISALTYGKTGIPMVDLGMSAVQAGKTMVGAMQSGDTKTRKLATWQTGTTVAELAGVPGASQLGEVAQNRLKAVYFKSHQARVDEVADRLFGKHNNLTTSQRVQVEREYDKTKPRMTRQDEESAGSTALRNNQKRGEALQSQLDNSQQQWLDKNELRLPGHGDRVKVRGQDVTLTKEELSQFEGYLKEEYSKRIRSLQNPGFANLPPSGKKSVFDAQSKAASESARARMAGEINKH